MHCPGENATDPIWRVLASSDGISSWTPLKPQHSIPCWLSVQWEPSAFRSCQGYKKRDHQKFVGGFALSDFLGLRDLLNISKPHPDLSHSYQFWMGHTSKKFKTEIWMSFSRFTRSGSMLLQQRLSACALSERSIEVFQQPLVYFLKTTSGVIIAIKQLRMSLVRTGCLILPNLC